MREYREYRLNHSDHGVDHGVDINAPLPAKREAFIAYFLQTLNASESARLAGYREPKQESYRLLRDPRVAARVRQAMIDRGMDAAEVVARLSDIARASIEDIGTIDDTGEFHLDLRQLKRSGRSHVVKKVVYRRDTNRTVEVELHNSLEALEKLARIHRLFGEQVQSTPAPTVNVTISMEEKREAVRAFLMEVLQQSDADSDVIDAVMEDDDQGDDQGNDQGNGQGVGQPVDAPRTGESED